MSIKENVERLKKEIGDRAIIEAAAKTRSAEEINEAVEAGIEIIGENYVAELKRVYPLIKQKVSWHFIGSTRTQKHDLLKRKIIEILDMIETVEDLEFASELNRRCGQLGKVISVLVEVNSAKEPQKSGVLPENAIELVEGIAGLENIKVEGLMTMGPAFGDPEKLRPYFRLTKELFETIKDRHIPNVEMKYLSMGMSDSYMIAIEEGANLIRLGSAIFGPRRR